MREPRQVSWLLGYRRTDDLQGLLCLWPTATFNSGTQAPSLLPVTLIVTCQGVLSWAEALADMFPTPHMVSMSWDTSAGVRSRRGRRQVRGAVPLAVPLAGC